MAGDWPRFDAARDGPTIAVLHLASQLLGKIRIARAPWVNHGWHAALHADARGLATAATDAGDGRSFRLALDLVEHAITLTASDGACDQVALSDGGTIAGLHHDVIAMLERHQLPSEFHDTPNEVPDASPFAADQAPRAYRRESAGLLLAMLARIVPVFERFRAGFVGKSSPVHFWWGSFDLAVTRFSGRDAPPHPGGIVGLPDRVTREAYSHEVSSAGFWPGNAAMSAEPIFYSYAYPEPAGFRDTVLDAGAYDPALGEFVLGYEAVRGAADPEARLMGFLTATYAAAADRAKWDRPQLERPPVAP